jgi:hypothetical protein
VVLMADGQVLGGTLESILFSREVKAAINSRFQNRRA